MATARSTSSTGLAMPIGLADTVAIAIATASQVDVIFVGIMSRRSRVEWRKS